MVNTILKEADLFCPNSVRINFTIYLMLILKALFLASILKHIIIGFPLI
ncbi:ABC transporter ATP-binding protein [Latilactobacillus curvatus]|nr:ABC transporter ATP-binding protein [Latilactobacillus curvatus]